MYCDIVLYTGFDINRKIRRNTFWRVAPPTGKQPRAGSVIVPWREVPCVGKHRESTDGWWVLAVVGEGKK